MSDKKAMTFRLEGDARKHLSEISATMKWSGARTVEEALLVLWRQTFSASTRVDPQETRSSQHDHTPDPQPAKKPPKLVMTSGGVKRAKQKPKIDTGAAIGGVKRQTAIPKPAWKRE